MGNIAQGKAATANAYVMPFAPSRAVDGIIGPTNRWVSGNNGATPWLMVDLGAQSYINRYVVKSMGSAGWTQAGINNQQFNVSVSSDKINWTQIDTVTGNTLPVVDRTIKTAVFCRYVTISFTVGLAINPQLASVAEFEVYSAPCPNLSALTLSSGTLTPTFNGTSVFNYTAVVSTSTASITVTPTAIDSTSIIKVNGTVVTSGTASQVIPLSYGANTVTVVVTATDLHTTTYTVTVTRPSQYLSALTMNDGTNNVPFTPTFDGHNAFAYTASVGYDAANVTVTPTSDESTETITVNGTAVTSGTASQQIALSVGSTNVIKVISTAAAGKSQEYDIAVTRTSDPYLSSVAGMPITGTFIKTTLNYTGSTASSKLAIKPVSEDTAAAILVKWGTNSKQITSGSSVLIAFVSGLNTITITVNSVTGTDSRTYTFGITK